MPKKICDTKWEFSFKTWGKGTPVVFLHGLGGHPRQWHEYAVGLSQFHTVIVPNLTHLISSKERISFEEQVDHLHSFLKDIALEYGILNFVGQSFGASLLMAVAMKDPNIIDRVILINPMPPWPIRYFKNSFLRFFMRTSPLLTQLKSGLLKTPLGINFLKELNSVFPWPWLTNMIRHKSYESRRFQFFHLAMERFAWMLQKENWDKWTKWEIPADRSLLIYDPKDPLFYPRAYPELIEMLNIKNQIQLNHSGHVILEQNKFDIQLGIRKFLDPSYKDEYCKTA